MWEGRGGGGGGVGASWREVFRLQNLFEMLLGKEQAVEQGVGGEEEKEERRWIPGVDL